MKLNLYSDITLQVWSNMAIDVKIIFEEIQALTKVRHVVNIKTVLCRQNVVISSI